MATQRIRPEQGRDERQEAQRRQVNRTLTLGSLALAAVVGAIAVLMALVTTSADEQTASTTAVATAGEGASTATATPVVGGPNGSGPKVLSQLLPSRASTGSSS
jgi:hypothetical protein